MPYFSPALPRMSWNTRLIGNDQILPLRQLWEGIVRFNLVPVCHRRKIVLQREIPAFAFPTQALYGYSKILLETNRIRDMPPVLSDTTLLTLVRAW